MISFKLAVCGMSELPEVWEKTGADVVLSLVVEGPDWIRDAMPKSLGKPTMAVHYPMDDVEDPTDPLAPTEQDVMDILVEASMMEHGNTMIIHCKAGISRSTAAAYAILCNALGPGKEQEALDILLQIRPTSYPNRLIVAYADRILDRGGKMLETIEEFQKKNTVFPFKKLSILSGDFQNEESV